MTEADRKRPDITIYADESLQSEREREYFAKLAAKYGLSYTIVPSGGIDLPAVQFLGTTYPYSSINIAENAINAIYGQEAAVSIETPSNTEEAVK